jgi:hypothetical protein
MTKATDGELSRTMNALTATLNDQKVTEYDVDRFQEIVTGALGGQPKLRVHRASPTEGFLVDADGEQVVGLKRDGGRWVTEMLREARSSSAYVPSGGSSWG